ncbi:protein phosphatase 2C domain-containing protein [Aromatoleum aromaticum]|uniref:protein phosphatase 2C domain-containing protein n=1 Tax=Aromatoleum aromaticum TaxID=551760 RepID=UPI000A05D6A7|nr:serine/threonine-protein phosphatase [Aromatoleum aromaticum]
MPLIVETCIARHIGDRSEQQDRVAVFGHSSWRGTMMAILADGMGGHAGGELAAEQVVLQARRNFEACVPDSGCLGQLLERIVADAHRGIRQVRASTGTDPHSTAVALMLWSGQAGWIHCGDSRVYHFRGGETVRRSQDHSLVAELQRRGRLDEVAASSHPQRGVLLSCLGGHRPPQIAFGEAPARAGDNFLLCSDGLWRHFPDAELAAVIAANPAREAAETLVRLARRRAAGSGDNISLAIMKVCSGAGEAGTAKPETIAAASCAARKSPPCPRPPIPSSPLPHRSPSPRRAAA